MHFSLLGSLLVRIDRQERAVGGVKVRTLLAVLLLEANRPVPPDRLRTALWGDHPPASANASLHNMLARLRTQLDDGRGDRLRSTPLGYLLEVAEGELDTHLFDLGVQRARDALLREDWASVRRESVAALALWRGVPLAELPDLPQAQAPRRQWEEARLQALEWRIEAELRLGRVSGLVPELTRLTGEHPLHESFHAQLMLALHRLGQRSEALAAYQRLRRALVEELGIEPGSGVRKVHERVLRDEADEPDETEGAEGAGGTDEPEEAGAIAPPASAIRVQAQLPAGLADFTGRRAELRALTELLATSPADDVPRVAVVSGMGGIGKTALAVQAAHAVKHLFPDGQLYADLRGFGAGPARDPHELIGVLLAALDDRSAEQGGAARPLPEHVDDRAALLRTVLADRRVLLVLDNARDAAQVSPLLPGGCRSAVVVTTRNTLTDLPVSLRLSLAPYDVEEQRAFLSRLCGPERIRQDPDGAFRLLAACAGLPLALRITGARLSSRPAWSLGALAERLNDSRGRLRTAVNTSAPPGSSPGRRTSIGISRWVSRWPPAEAGPAPVAVAAVPGVDGGGVGRRVGADVVRVSAAVEVREPAALLVVRQAGGDLAQGRPAAAGVTAAVQPDPYGAAGVDHGVVGPAVPLEVREAHAPGQQDAFQSSRHDVMWWSFLGGGFG